MRELQATRGGFVYSVAGILTLAAVYACWCGAPLIWDGAYQLNFSLIVQHPYVYRTRFHTFFLWQPLVLMSRYTANRTALCMAFGMPFLLAPVVGLLVSWWLLRRQAPWLILWVIFGVAIAPLPGQIFVINDSIFQQHLFWPVFISLFVRLDWRKWFVLALLAVFQLVHPIGFVLLSGTAVAALGLAAADASRRRPLLLRACLAALLAAAAYWKLHHFVDPYAQDEMKADAIWRCWGGTRGFPVEGLAFMWAGGTLFWIGIQLQLRNTPTGSVKTRLGAMGKRTRLPMGPVSDPRKHGQASTFAHGTRSENQDPSPLPGSPWAFSSPPKDESHTPSPGTPGEGGGEGPRSYGPDPHPSPLPEYRARGPEADSARSFLSEQHARTVGPGRPNATLKSRSARWAFRLAFVCVLIGAAIWVYWAGDEHRWPWIAGYRRFVVPLTLPFYLLCWLDYAMRVRRGPGIGAVGTAFWPGYPLYRILGQLLAAVFAVVLGIQSTLFGSMVRRLIEDMRNYPGSIVPLSAVPWTVNTPMDHWAITDLAIAAQGKRPTQLLLNAEGIDQIRANPPVVPNQLVYPHREAHPPPPNSNGWYDLRPIVPHARP